MTACRTIAADVRSGRVSARAVAEAAIAAIREDDGRYDAVTRLLAPRALAQADAVDASVAAGRDPGPLAGVPYGVKDLFDIDGLPTTAGAAMRADARPARRDAEAIARLTAAGAVLVATLNMDEYAYGFATINAHHGTTRNPHDTRRLAGGSSGGSAAAVAAGMLPLTLGSDTNGSIRVPASLTGVYGLKPTHGALPMAGVFPFVDSFDDIGPFAGSVADLRLAWTVLRGGEATATEPNPRIARLGGWFRADTDPATLAGIDRIAEALGGAPIVEMPEVARARAAAFVMTAAEGGALHLPALRRDALAFDPATRDRLIAGALLPAATYLSAQRFRRWFADRAARLLADHDVLLAPAAPCVAPTIDDPVMTVDGRQVPARANLGIMTQPLSFIGLPVIAAPLVRPGALPLGIQIIGAPGREATLFAVAERLEAMGLIGALVPPAAGGPAAVIHTTRAIRGMVTAPHPLAAQAGRDVLADGGSAVEACVATAACLAVAYPHMTGIGGDGFWLVAEPDGRTWAIDACGAAAERATPAAYTGLAAVPWRGPLAAATVAGTMSGWQAALAASDSRMPLDRLLRDAVHHATTGVPVTAGGAAIAAAKSGELGALPGAYAAIFEPAGRPLAEGERLRQPALAATLRTLAAEGLDSFYRGSLAAAIAADLADLGSLVSAADLARHQPRSVTPLSVAIDGARVFNLPPPTQGIASLLILALFDRLPVAEPDGFDHVHALVEATKQAFLVRDAHVCDPRAMTLDVQALLDDSDALDTMASAIDPARALRWPYPAAPGDTTWFGAADVRGQVVSCIQSIYFEFGSGLVLPRTGITWQNRAAAFRLGSAGPNQLRPGAYPFHTLNPALARFDDGRVMAYGTMGGEGQPQTQAAIFTRYARGVPLQQAVTAPRWLLGRTWGEASTSLKIEPGFAPSLYAALADAGHDIEVVPAYSMMMGHAGALVRHADGLIEGAADPRGDGMVAPW